MSVTFESFVCLYQLSGQSYDYHQDSMNQINIPLGTLINFMTFFQGLRPYSGLHRAFLSSISIRYKWGYAYSFCQIFQGLCLFKGVRLFQTLEYGQSISYLPHRPKFSDFIDLWIYWVNVVHGPVPIKMHMKFW